MIADVLPGPDWLRDVPLAHRGLHSDMVPENSLASFAAARDSDVGIELDVRLSADGTPVVVHDATVELDGQRVAVADLTDDQLASVDVGDASGVPSLAAALSVAGSVPVMVEVKNESMRVGRLEAAVAGVLALHDQGPTCVASFNPLTLRWLRRRRPAVTRVLTISPGDDTMPPALQWTLRSLRLLARVEPAALSCDVNGLEDEDTRQWHEAGGTLVTWTVRTPAELETARRLADQVIFEDLPPDQVR